MLQIAGGIFIAIIVLGLISIGMYGLSDKTGPRGFAWLLILTGLGAGAYVIYVGL